MQEVLKLQSGSAKQIRDILSKAATPWKATLIRDIVRFLISHRSHQAFGLVEERTHIKQLLLFTINEKSATNWLLSVDGTVSSLLFDTLCIASSSNTPTVIHHTIHMDPSLAQAFELAWAQSRLGSYTSYKASNVINGSNVVTAVIDYPS
jgi:hypothetical protein